MLTSLLLLKDPPSPPSIRFILTPRSQTQIRNLHSCSRLESIFSNKATDVITTSKIFSLERLEFFLSLPSPSIPPPLRYSLHICGNTSLADGNNFCVDPPYSIGYSLSLLVSLRFCKYISELLLWREVRPANIDILFKSSIGARWLKSEFLRPAGLCNLQLGRLANKSPCLPGPDEPRIVFALSNRRKILSPPLALRFLFRAPPLH